MKYLEPTKKETGEIIEKSNSEIYVEIAKAGALFSLYDKDYFTLGIDEDYQIFYCEKKTTTLEIKSMTYDETIGFIEKKVIAPKDDEDYILVDESLLKEEELETYTKLKDAMGEIINKYSPDFSYLTSKTYKTHLKELAKNCNMSYRNFRLTLTRFMTSGMKHYALLSQRSAAFGDRRKRNKSYNYTKKTGRKARDHAGNIIVQGIIIDDKIKEGIIPYADLVAQGLSIPQAFTRYNTRHCVKEDALQNGNVLLLDKSERPTQTQFARVIETHLKAKDKIMGRKGYLGYYNDHRPLTGDTLTGTSHPGDIIEIDAWEADISLVRENNPTDVIGRPTLYLMVDRYTRMIVAFYVGFEVNSYQGLSSLFMNMVEDKEELFKRYGFNIERNKIPLPEAFIPNTVVTDNGSDFKSKAFRDALSSLGIEHQVAPPRSGSAKGLVERTFGEFAHDHKDAFKGAGLIKKEYGSKHHEEATLNINEYTRLLILAIVKHNFTTMTTYPLHDMDLINKNINLSPISLWNYYTKEKMLNPKTIYDKESFYFSIMKQIKVSLKREGIVFEGLIYDLGEDLKLHELQEREKTKHLDFRLDPRDVSRLYYLDEGQQLRWCELSKTKASNSPFFGISYSEAKSIKAKIRDKNRAAAESNEDLKATTTILTDYLVNEAAQNKKENTFEENDTKNIREKRKEEKYKRAKEEKIANHLEAPEEDEDVIEQDDYENINDTCYEDFLEQVM